MKKIVIYTYILSLFALTIFSFAFIDPNLQFLRMLFTGFYSKYRFAVVITYLSLLTLVYICYLMFIRLSKFKKINIKIVINLLIITALILFLAYPAMLSYDIFNYIATAKLTFLYKENPYIIMPIEFIGDPLLLFMHAANKTALYGPVWILITGLPHSLGFNNFILTIYLFKLINVFFYFLTAIILFKISKSWYPVLLFNLNPLVIIESLISSHNDIVMMGLALLSLYMLKQKRILISFIILALSIGIKFASIFLLPVFIYVIYNIKYKRNFQWENVYLYSAICMFTVFLLSPFREEMYPWYGIWFYIFISLISNKIILKTSILFLFGLSLRYIPFLFNGTYNEATIYLRTIIMYLPLIAYLITIPFSRIKKYFK